MEKDRNDNTIYTKTVEKNGLGVKVNYACTVYEDQKPEYELSAFVSQDYKQPYKQFLERKKFKYLHLDEFLDLCRRIFDSIFNIFKNMLKKNK